MVIIVQDREFDNEMHIVDMSQPNGDKLTLCGLEYKKFDIVNTLAADLSIRSICSICADTYQQMYDDDLNYMLRGAHGNLLGGIRANRMLIEMKMTDTKNKFFMLQYRFSEKINKYKRLASKRKSR